jgi:flagellar P-ring protein precursor FlgI
LLSFNFHEPNFTSAFRIAESIDQYLGGQVAKAKTASHIDVTIPSDYQSNLVSLIMQIQEISVNPDIASRVVVNERTGTVVSGGNVKVSPVTITHGDLNVSIKSDFFVSQPTLVRDTSAGVQTQTIQQSEITVSEEVPFNVSLPENITVAELVTALNKVKASSRDVIVILQSIKRAGALHAELVIQ